MPIVSKFVFETDESGVLGFRPVGIKGGTSTPGVAHDILEHFPDPKLSGVEGELMALGAMLALRIETGAVSPHRSAAEHLALVMTEVVKWCADNCRTVKPLPSKSLHHCYAWAENTIQEAARMVHGFVVRNDRTRKDALPEPQALALAVIPWLRLGYRKALRRYDGLNLYTVGNHFFNKVDKFSEKLQTSEILEEGTEVTFLVSPRNGSIKAVAYGQELDWC